MPINKKFRKKVRQALANAPLRKALGNFADTYPQARESVYKDIDFEDLRNKIETIKAGSVEQVEELARRFEEKVKSRGGRFHHAKDGEEVARIITDIARQHNAGLCVKSKSMATEEIHLNRRLKDVLWVVETDLGEWLIQQIDERPSHMVMPAIHLTREKCAEIFSKKLGIKVEPDIPHMVKLARRILRDEFLKADIGISGCNIAVAETGTMVLFTNEGNGRLTSTLPPVHIVLLGYEKLVPRFRDIAPLAAAIPRSATCQYISSYVTMISAPTEGKELHVILLDNGRLELLKDPIFKKIGQCIRCASCLNFCPVYSLVGGQVYGAVYTGGIGALLTAFLSSPEEAEKIQELCLNCGKCRDFCPGKIDIPSLILELRARIRGKIPPPFFQQVIIDKVLPNKAFFDISLKVAVPGIRFLDRLPQPAPRTFRMVFKELTQEIKEHKGTIAFFYGCMIDYVYPEIGRSIVYLLNRAGYRVEAPGQNCCGAPALYTGLESSAKKMVADNLRHFARELAVYDYIVTACPTGAVMLKKHWPRLLADDPEAHLLATAAADKTVDFIKLYHALQKQGMFAAGEADSSEETNFAVAIDVTYHYSCHLKRSSGIDKEPREVLTAIPGIRWLKMDEADRCCGFAGTYSMKLPEVSAELLQRKIKCIEKSGAQIVLTDCPGCLLSLRNGLKAAGSDVQAFHSAVFLAQRTIYTSGRQKSS